MIHAHSTTDRSRAARRKSRRLNRRGWIQHIIDGAKQFADTLDDVSMPSLTGHTERLRNYVGRQHGANPTPVDDDRMLVMAAAAVIEAIRRTLGLTLFDTQLHAGIIVSQQAVAEMQTGEGKTLAVALPAYYRSLFGRGVHVATPNHYLASRDHAQLMPVFESLGVTTGVLTEGATPDQTRAAYQADVTYGPGHAFGFDYLRDQLTLDRFHSPRLGQDLYRQWLGDLPEGERLQRGLHAAIIDEIDHVLIDDAVSPLLLSGSDPGESPDGDVHRTARICAEQLIAGQDYQQMGPGSIQLTEPGFSKVYRQQTMVVHPALVRPWHEYVVLALRALHCYRRDVHFVVRDSKVRIVDVATGRILPDRSWSDGLHQAVEARENLSISCENLPLARITRQRFYRYYESLAGMTGTASGCEREFASVYGLPIREVPLRIPSQRQRLDDHISLTRAEKLVAIAAECAAMVEADRAVLIGTQSIAESIEVADQLSARGVAFQLLNGVQDQDEADVVSEAGRRGAVTVATNLAGRGTDIGLDPKVRACGGLHVIVTQQHSLSRVDRQLIGRCARCGDPGSARVFLAADDEIAVELAPWLGRAIKRWSRSGRVADLVLRPRIARVQNQQQQLASSHRWRMLSADQQEEALLAKPSQSPASCAAL